MESELDSDDINQFKTQERESELERRKASKLKPKRKSSKKIERAFTENVMSRDFIFTTNQSESKSEKNYSIDMTMQDWIKPKLKFDEDDYGICGASEKNNRSNSSSSDDLIKQAAHQNSESEDSDVSSDEPAKISSSNSNYHSTSSENNDLEKNEKINNLRNHLKKCKISASDQELYLKNAERLLLSEFESDYKLHDRDFNSCDFLAVFPSFSKAARRRVQLRMSHLFWTSEQVTLDSFNQVNHAVSLDPAKDIFRALKRPEPPNRVIDDNEPAEDCPNPFADQVLDLMIGFVKRAEPLDNMLSFVSITPWIDADFELAFTSKRFLVCWLLASCDSATRLRCQVNISKIMAVPLTFRDPYFYTDGREAPMSVNFELVPIVLESHSLLNVSLGRWTPVGGRPERLLNQLFHTRFEESRALALREGCVDVNFDHNSDCPRERSFINVYGSTEDEKLVEWLMPVVNMLVVQTNTKELLKKDSGIAALIKSILALKQKGMKVFLLVWNFERAAKIQKAEVEGALESAGKMVKIILMEAGKNGMLSESEKKCCRAINKEFKKMKNKSKEPKMTETRLRPILLDEASEPRRKRRRLGSQFLKKRYKKRKREKGVFKSCLEQIDKFTKMIKKSVAKGKLDEELFMADLLVRAKNLSQNIRQDIKLNVDLEYIKPKEIELEQFRKRMATDPPSALIKSFRKMVMSSDHSLLLLLLPKRLGRLNTHLKEQKARDLASKHDKKGFLNISKPRFDFSETGNHDDSDRDVISLQVLFRNLFGFIDKSRRWPKPEDKVDLADRIMQLLLQGFSFEFLTRSSLNFGLKLLQTHLNELGLERVFTVGVLGPQSSGKSTLLNSMFGTTFDTSQGRCTQGLHMSLQPIRQARETRFLVIIDSEGLHGTERNDPEFENKMCLFLMNTCDCLLVNVKSEFGKSIYNDLQFALFSANLFRSFRTVSEVFFVFNQINENSRNTVKTLKNQIKRINDNIQAKFRRATGEVEQGGRWAAWAESGLLSFQPDEKHMHLLGNAFHSKTIDKDSDLGRARDLALKWKATKFGESSSELARRVLAMAESPQTGRARKSLRLFLEQASQKWRLVDEFLPLVELESFYEDDAFDLALGECLREEEREIYGYLEKYSNELIGEIKKSENLRKLCLNQYTDKTMKMKTYFKRQTTNIKKKIERQTNYNQGRIERALDAWRGQFELSMAKITLKVQNEHNKKALELCSDELSERLDDVIARAGSGQDSERIEGAFTETVREYGIELDREREQEKYLEVLWSILESMNVALPPRAHKSWESIDEETCAEELKHFLSGNNSKLNVLVHLENVARLDPEFDKRVRNNRYLDLGAFEVLSEVAYFTDFEAAFQKKKLQKEILLFFADKKMIEKQRFEKGYEILQRFREYGVCFDLARKKSFVRKMSGSGASQRQSFIKTLFENVELDPPEKIDEIEDCDLAFFELAQKKWKKKDISVKLARNRLRFFLKGPDRVERAGLRPDPSSELRSKLFINPFDWSFQSEVVHAMRCTVLELLDYRRVVRVVRRVCRLAFETVSAKVSRQDMSWVSGLMRKIVSSDLQRVFGRINESLGICGAQMSDMFEGYLVHLAALFVWKELMERVEKSRRRKLGKLEQIKQDFLLNFENKLRHRTSVRAFKKIDKCIKKWLNDYAQYLSDKLHEKAEEILGHNKVKRRFRYKTVKKQLDAELAQALRDNEISMKNALDHFKNPENYVAKKFQALKEQHFDKCVETLNNELRDSINDALEYFRFITDLIKDCFEASSQKRPFAFCRVRDKNGKKMRKSDYSGWEEQLGRFGCEMLIKMLLGESIEAKKDMKTEFSIETRYDKKKFKNKYPPSKLNKVWKKIEKQLNRLFKNASKYPVNCIRDLARRLRLSIERHVESLQKHQLSINSPRINDLLQTYSARVWGCQARCPFCGQKCEHPGHRPHKHHAHKTGHRPRFIEKQSVLLGKEQVACLATCESIRSDLVVEYQGVPVTWKQKLGLEWAWDIQSGKSLEEVRPRLQVYVQFWERYGAQLCRRFNLGFPGQSIGQFIESYNQGQRNQRRHFCVLISRESLNPRKAIRVQTELQQFIRFLRDRQLDSCSVSILVFASEIKSIREHVDLRDFNDDFRIPDHAEGFDLAKALKKACAIIKKRKNERHDLILYSANNPEYPEKGIEKMLKINRKKPNLTFFWMLDKDIKSGKIRKVQKKCRKRLSANHCVFFKKAKISQMGSKLVDIFYHK